jgi:Bacteriophage baseplate protein W
MSYAAFPRQVDDRGRTLAAGVAEHVRTLVEQVLFTAPGERVNRPQFGSGLLQLVFAGDDGSLAAATQVAVEGALQTWLGGVVDVQDVRVTTRDAALEVTVAYLVRATGEVAVETLRRPE